MTPWFVLSYPRSRTAWLATYLTHNGVYAFHEAWKYAKTVAQLRALMESKGPGPVVNVDCANWFFVKELQEAFPEARFVEIQRPWVDVVRSARDAFGEQDYDALFKRYQRAMEQPVERQVIQCDAGPERWYQLWLEIAQGQVMDEQRHLHLHNCQIMLTEEAVRDELQLGQCGALTHITRRMHSA